MGANFGKRLRDVRKRRGMTQRELASTSGVSISLIRKLEQGERDDTRLETVHRLAVALHVPTTRLLVEDRQEHEAAIGSGDQGRPIHNSVLAPKTRTGIDEPPTVAGVKETLTSALPLFSGDKLTELSTLLPSLVCDVNTLAEIDAEGRALRMRVMQLTGWLLTQTRQFDAARVALERSLEDCSNPLQAASTVSTQCWLLLRTGKLGEAWDLATRWADEIEPRMSRATPAELSAWGWLLLRASAASIRDNRPEDAETTARFARSAAVALGREFAPANDFLMTFGPTTVALKRAENAMVSNKPDTVLKLSATIPVGGMRATSNNRNRHLLDVANAHAVSRQYGQAVEILQGLRHDAPEWLPNQRYAQDILQRVVSRRRTLTPEMRELADAVGMPL
jgi:transcriptional regulator with XRE-family HTH domain